MPTRPYGSTFVNNLVNKALQNATSAPVVSQATTASGGDTGMNVYPGISDLYADWAGSADSRAIQREQMGLDRELTLAELAQQRELAEMQQRLSQQGLGLDFMQTLASLKGPRDWLTYSNLINRTSGTALPGYAQQLMGNTPGFGGLNFNALFQNSYAPMWQAQNGTNAAGGGGDARTAAMQAIWNNRPDIQQFYAKNWGGSVDPIAAMNNWLGMTNEQVGDPIQYAAGRGWANAAQAGPTLPNMQPHQISAQSWQRMLPTQREMLYGQLEQQGIDPMDYVSLMQNAFPTGNARQGTYYG
ncbi:MAG: hypothetical protein KJ884_07515 [Gammaproteobacteria bacterium]|nr:hypothetical protein [Gammaproteobacteria bacterium]